MTAVAGPALGDGPRDPLPGLGIGRGVALRLAVDADAEALAVLCLENREYLRPWEPERAESYFTVEGQRANLRALLDAYDAGEMWPAVILVDGEVVGRITLNNILRGPLQSCFVGYWVARAHAGRGVATEAVRQALDVAFDELLLHRVEAFTRIDNHASQRVLEHNGFTVVGTARHHIHVDGRWHDERFFERLAPWDDGIAPLPPA
ncbi:GNAT family N-acetyltransferase [Actinomadura terrae]|uniref:GNAT family N-acetyltransferase n=1 Tax=Actinomadura terrae TaxID=604353 RepID=UPI001FA6D214|nr:GNAT family protein [Actinomadura terrae]